MRFIHNYHLVSKNPLMFLWFMLWYRTPDQSKRMCVLASLYARLMECQPDDRECLERVNQEMGLSRDTNALKFPAAISRWIWKNILPIKRIDLEHEEHYVARLVKKTPCWLWYADAETRYQDIQRLVELCTGRQEPDHLQAAA